MNFHSNKAVMGYPDILTDASAFPHIQLEIKEFYLLFEASLNFLDFMNDSNRQLVADEIEGHSNRQLISDDNSNQKSLRSKHDS